MMQTDKKILGVITARGGSKGIPGKNIKDLGGKPLIAYAIEAAHKSMLLTDTIVSTDDPEIARVAEDFKAKVPFMRPKELAQDDTPHLPVMQHALKEMEARTGNTYDGIVILHPTSPFRLTEDIDGCINSFIETGADSAVSIMKVEHRFHPTKVSRMVQGVLEPYIKESSSVIRRQELPDVYARNAAVYVTKRSVLMEKNSLYGDMTVGYEMPHERSLDIDEPLDWDIAEYMLNTFRGKWGL